MHNNLQPIGSDKEDMQQKHIMKHITAQINDSGKWKASRNRTKMHEVSPNYRAQLMILAKPLVGMAEYR